MTASSILTALLVAATAPAWAAGALAPAEPALPAPYDAPVAPPPQALDPETPKAPVARRRERSVSVPVPDTRPARHAAVFGQFGLGTPLGLYGIEAMKHLGDVAEIAAGVGLGAAAITANHASFAHVVQWSVMPRLRFGGDDVRAFTAGVGVSGGGFAPFGICADDVAPCITTSRYVIWANVELGREILRRSGFAMRYFLGVAQGWTTGNSAGQPRGDQTTLPYGGIAFGYGF